MESGTRLGPYEIVEQLGAGGMGEVYLATDTRLGRQVAVKVLPGEFAGDAERLARFEQEARAAAALNHPHIAAVFDVGHEDGTHYIVQEYLQGEVLRASLDRGALPIKRALALGTEVAEALQAAHRAGVVHRDLKPENIFITEDGHAKVLDFGLAKLTETSPEASRDQTASPTMLATRSGTVMGTAGYMAPEQVNGTEVDARADIFAFGCVLHEMATGQRAFHGPNLIRTLDRIVNEEPEPPHELDATLPLELHDLLRKTLAKDPQQRRQTAADLLVDLGQLVRDVDTGATRVAAGAATHAGAAVPVLTAVQGGIGLAAAVLVVASAGTWLLTRPEPPVAAPQVRFEVEVPGDGESSTGGRPIMALAPDGTGLVFVASGRLWIRRLGELDAVPIAGLGGRLATVLLARRAGDRVPATGDAQAVGSGRRSTRAD